MPFFSVRNPNVKNLPINVQHVTPGYYQRPTPSHIHPQVELAICTKGSCIYYTEQKQYLLQEGDCIFINAYVEHCTEFNPPEAAIDIVYFRLNQFESQKINKKAPVAWSLLKESDTHTALFQRHPIYNLVNAIIDEFDRAEPFYDVFIKAHIINVLGIMYREKQLASPYTEIDEKKYSKLKPLFNYLEANYPQQISSHTACSILGLNSSYFSRMFKEITGQNFSEYLIKFRLSKAVEMLNSTQLTISEIALNTGFSSSSYFIETFKKYYFCSPSDFRKKLT